MFIINTYKTILLQQPPQKALITHTWTQLHACISFSQDLWVVTSTHLSFGNTGSPLYTSPAKGVGALAFCVSVQLLTTRWITHQCKSTLQLHICTPQVWVLIVASCIDSSVAGCRHLTASSREDASGIGRGSDDSCRAPSHRVRPHSEYHSFQSSL